MRKFCIVDTRLSIFTGFLINLTVIPLVGLFITQNFNLLLLLPLVGLIYLNYWYFGRKIIISSQGIESKVLFKSKKFLWENIQSVCVGVGVYSRGLSVWIYFSLDKTILNNIEASKNNENIIVIMYRPKIIREIQKYWKYRIDGLNNTKFHYENIKYPYK